MVQEIKGDLLDTDCRIIAHGVNCQNVMGSGVARALFMKWPEVKFNYHQMFNEFHDYAGEEGEGFMGSIQAIELVEDKIVVNCFTQMYYGNDFDTRYLSYDALEECMWNLYDLCLEYGEYEVAIPLIGCGLAGGEWSVVKAILEVVFPEEFTVKVYIK